MKCPVCRATYRSLGSQDQVVEGEAGSDSLLCHRCGADLTALIHLHDQAIWHYRQAVLALGSGDEVTAIAQNNQALVLASQNADFHVLAGQLWARQGEFWQAIAAWKKAQQLDPQHPTVNAFLQCLIG
jgi:Flp pilus assembly protein TadD